MLKVGEAAKGIPELSKIMQNYVIRALVHR